MAKRGSPPVGPSPRSGRDKSSKAKAVASLGDGAKHARSSGPQQLAGSSGSVRQSPHLDAPDARKKAAKRVAKSGVTDKAGAPKEKLATKVAKVAKVPKAAANANRPVSTSSASHLRLVDPIDTLKRSREKAKQSASLKGPEPRPPKKLHPAFALHIRPPH